MLVPLRKILFFKPSGGVFEEAMVLLQWKAVSLLTLLYALELPGKRLHRVILPKLLFCQQSNNFTFQNALLEKLYRKLSSYLRIRKKEIRAKRRYM